MGGWFLIESLELALEIYLFLARKLTSTSQSVRRKGGKLGKGYVYIICSLNPKHKQRQGK